MQEIDFMSVLHKSTKRDYLGRVNDTEYPKSKAAVLAKKFDFDYWDGDRRICYGGYKYIEGRWEKVAIKLIDHYKLDCNSRILDIGCGKGYLLYDLKKLLPGISVKGIDISNYALENSKDEIKDSLTLGNASYSIHIAIFFFLGLLLIEAVKAVGISVNFLNFASAVCFLISLVILFTDLISWYPNSGFSYMYLLRSNKSFLYFEY